MRRPRRRTAIAKGSGAPTDGIAKLLKVAESKKLVLFVGAGASMAAPTNLPSWRDVNRIVVRSLAAGAASVLGGKEAENAAALILERHARERLPPEYQAQVLAELLHKRYFEVLRHLDSPYPNPTHLAVAWLARLGCVRAIITTNFDRLIEAAFSAVGTPLKPYFRPDHFSALVADLGRFERPGDPCQLLKLHGSVDDPATLIDTLAQRKRGFALPVMKCVEHLLRSGHWLFLGFSGLDLEAEPNYLNLLPEAAAAGGFTWFVRNGNEPVPAVVRLRERYGDRGEFVYGELPDWLLDFTSEISAEPRRWIGEYKAQQTLPDAGANTSELEAAARDWAANLTPTMCALSLTLLISVCAEPQTAARLAAEILKQIEAREAQAAAPSAGLLIMKSQVANALGNLLAGLGRYEEAVHWITLAVDEAEKAGDEDTRDRWLGNLGVNVEALGRIDEATKAYQSALAGYRRRGDPMTLAFGLTSLASHLIRQMRLDEARTLVEEAVECARQAGDERMRGTALNDLGIIAKLKQDYPAALKIFDEIEQLFTRLGNDEAAAAAAGNRGEVLAALGRFDEAEQIQTSVLKVHERLDQRDHQAAACLSLGMLNQLRGDPAAAERWFNRALAIYRDIKDSSNEGFTLYRLASLMSKTERFEEALPLAQAGLPLVAERNPALTADLLAQVGMANLKLGYVVRAADAYRNAIPLFEELGATEPLAAATMNLGTALLLYRSNDEAAAAFVRAAELWQRIGSPENIEYCKQGEATVRLDMRLAALSDAGHAQSDPEKQRAAACEMVRLYPDLIAGYEKISAMQLVAECCATAANTAEFAGELPHAVDWYRQAAMFFANLGLQSRALKALTGGESLLQRWADLLLRRDKPDVAVPVLLQLAEVSGQLGHRESCATAMLNAAICRLATEQYAEARGLAAQAAPLFAAGSDDAAMAQKVIAKCAGHLGAG